MNTNIKEFEKIINDITTNSTVQEMKNFRQHCSTSCYDHCRNVSYYSYIICKKFGLDYVSCARAGMLHDLFLYDWRVKTDERKGLHAFRHPRIALNNSLQLFNLNNKEKDIILKHMWPCTIIPPKYLESYIITFVDKYCAIKESINCFKDSFTFKKLYRYAYVFLCLLIFRIV